MQATRTCSIPDCDTGGRLRRGWCTKHYNRWLTHGDPTQDWPAVDYASRFETFVDRTTTPDGCHVWTGARHGQGYGLFKVGRERRLARAHRFAWELVHGPIPELMVVRHRCDNPPCVRVEHLELGTQDDNVADRVARRGR